MKKKLIVAGAVICVLAIMIAIGMRQADNIDDVAIVRGVRPIAWQPQKGYFSGKDVVQRVYSLHMSYDDAVKALEKELGPKGWTHSDWYELSMFFAGSPASDEHIRVTRGRVLKGIEAPYPPLNKKKIQSMPDLKDDSRGWVMITTNRSINPIEGFFGRLRKRFNPRGMPYAIVAPAPRKGGSDQKVDVTAGSMHLEGDGNYVRFWGG